MDPTPTRSDPPPQLDERHVLEPIRDDEPGWSRRLTPVVTDLYGRHWRVRRTALAPDVMSALVAALCVAVIMCAWLIVGNI